MAIGIPSSDRTNNSTLTRDELIVQAYKEIGALSEGETLRNEMHADGRKRLNLIIRELDVAGKWLWAMTPTPASLTLSANVWSYSSPDLQENILELVKVMYRDAQAVDYPVTILSTEGYAGISNKLETGDTCQVFLTPDQDVTTKTLFIWPAPYSVNTQSVVTGSDAANYSCIRSHTADSTNEPVTGANYLQYWVAGGSSPSTWAEDTEYTAPLQLLYWYKRPLYDFVASDDNPDLPPQWTRYLLFRLAKDLAPGFGVPLDERQALGQEAAMAYERIFPSVVPKTTDFHNRASYM